VQWCPHNRHLFASCSNDRRAVIWDDSKCGELDEYEEPAEIVFIHSGHKTEIVELDWAPERYVVGTVDTGGGLQVWRMPEGVG
jgi:WD40 repeat protein